MPKKASEKNTKGYKSKAKGGNGKKITKNFLNSNSKNYKITNKKK